MFHSERQSHFTQFTLDLLPTVGCNTPINSLSSLRVKPLLQAVNMYRLHGTIAHTRRDKGILDISFFFAQTDPTSISICQTSDPPVLMRLDHLIVKRFKVLLSVECLIGARGFIVPAFKLLFVI